MCGFRTHLFQTCDKGTHDKDLYNNHIDIYKLEETWPLYLWRYEIVCTHNHQFIFNQLLIYYNPIFCKPLIRIISGKRRSWILQTSQLKALRRKLLGRKLGIEEMNGLMTGANDRWKEKCCKQTVPRTTHKNQQYNRGVEALHIYAERLAQKSDMPCL